MADTVDITPGTGATVATDDVGGVHYQRIKISDGTADSATVVAAGGGTEANALRVTVASDSTGVLSIDDNDSSLTVDATDLDIRNLNQTQDAVKVGDGTNLIDVDTAPTDAEVNGGKRLLHTEAWLWAFNGTTWDRLRSDTTNGLDVDVTRVGGNVTVVQSTASSLNTQTIGAVATDGALSTNNPVIVGGRASTAIPTAVSADGDAVNIWANRNGAQVVTGAPHVGLNGSPWTLTSTSAQYTTQQTSTALATVGAGTAIVVTSYQIQATGTTAGAVQLYFGTGAYSRGTTPAVFDGSFVPSATSYPGVVQTGVWMGATDADLRVTTSAAINSLTVTVWYYLVS